MTETQIKIKDVSVWIRQLNEHRRQLLERLIAAFPEELKDKKDVVNVWRKKLRMHA
jgi:hypothetical protein